MLSTVDIIVLTGDVRLIPQPVGATHMLSGVQKLGKINIRPIQVSSDWHEVVQFAQWLYLSTSKKRKILIDKTVQLCLCLCNEVNFLDFF